MKKKHRLAKPPPWPSGLFWDDGFFLKILHKESFAFLDDRVPLCLELLPDGLDAAGVFRVDLSVALECAPVRGDAFAPLLRQFVRSVGGDPRENAGRNWAGKVRLVFAGERSAKLVVVVSLPLGTFFISASTSSGAGMTNRPSPNFFENLPSPLSPYFGKSLESWSLAFQLILTRLTALTQTACRRPLELQPQVEFTTCPGLVRTLVSPPKQ